MWMALLASFVAFANAYFGLNLTGEQLLAVIAPMLAYIGVEGAADTVERFKTNAVKQAIAEQGSIPPGFELDQSANGLVPGKAADTFTPGQ